MTTHWTPELHAHLQTLASTSGFHLAGVAPATSVSDPRFTTWIESGHAGEMDYLKRRDEQGTLLRSAVQVAIPWAQSIIVCAFNYNAPAPCSIDPAPANTGWIARYAWSGKPGPDGALLPTDYHDDLLARLRLIESGLRQHTPCETRCYVDTGPILERDLAARAGIGWIGKNTCVLNQTLGSWLLLGAIVTSLPLAPETPLTIATDRCGSCTRCIDACPTDALIAPRQMDASLCIAYLTIEKKGSIPEPLRAPMGRQVFGCDICQDVCPWNEKTANRKAPIATSTHRPELVNPPLTWLAELDSISFKQNFKGSPLERTKIRRVHRNTAIAMGNSGNPDFLPQLRLWANAEDPILAETAQWAIAAIHRALSPETPGAPSSPQPHRGRVGYRLR